MAKISAEETAGIIADSLLKQLLPDELPSPRNGPANEVSGGNSIDAEV